MTQDREEEVFLGTVTAVTDTIGTSSPWVVKVKLNDQELHFKVDTGADVTVIPEAMYCQERDGELQPCQVPLRGPTDEALEVSGKFTGDLAREGVTCQQTIYVIRNLSRALLGKPAIEALKVVALVERMEEDEIVKQFPEVFNGLGRLSDSYTIKLKEEATPFALTTPRRVPIPLLPKVRDELQRMENMGVITKIKEPISWCAGMVVVPKPNGKVRICVDLTKLNESVCRERLILPAVDQTLAQIGEAKYFSKLDANSGYWQIELDPDSAKLTTFITPFGRFHFNRLPFGITSAPEHFQRRMMEIVGDIEGVVCLVDDILVCGNTQEEHDQRLVAVLSRLKRAGLTLGRDKCEINRRSVKFLGQMVDEAGVRPDPGKVRAIKLMKAPSTVSELRRFLGMVTQLGKFLPHLTDLTKPLRDLLSTKNQWRWGHDQRQAFENLKRVSSSSELLALYNVNHETIVSADASSYGYGAVLRQRQPDGSLRPIAYASRALTETEQRYAQIEKEALAVTWGCERFQDYLLGISFRVETDHKPLVPLLSFKPLEAVPIRVQRFRLRLMRFSFSISHVPGEALNTADTLSRAPVTEADQGDKALNQDVEAYVNLVVKNLPATNERLRVIQEQQDEDLVCSELKRYCQQGRIDWTGALKPYFSVRTELAVVNGLLLRGNRMVIPSSLQADILEKLHSAHQGTTKCRQRARVVAGNQKGCRRDCFQVSNVLQVHGTTSGTSNAFGAAGATLAESGY